MAGFGLAVTDSEFAKAADEFLHVPRDRRLEPQR
jgi:hypothetical protein